MTLQFSSAALFCLFFPAAVLDVLRFRATHHLTMTLPPQPACLKHKLLLLKLWPSSGFDLLPNLFFRGSFQSSASFCLIWTTMSRFPTVTLQFDLLLLHYYQVFTWGLWSRWTVWLWPDWSLQQSPHSCDCYGTLCLNYMSEGGHHSDPTRFCSFYWD